MERLAVQAKTDRDVVEANIETTLTNFSHVIYSLTNFDDLNLNLLIGFSIFRN